MLTAAAPAVCAETYNAAPSAPQLDEICGYVKVNVSTEEDLYVRILKHTPETDEEGYTVYDSVIKADSVRAGDIMIYSLEYNNYNGENESYDGSYDIYIGMHKTKDSQDADDILYQKLSVLVCDVNYCGFETFCTINVNTVKEELEAPKCEAEGELPDITYNITFPLNDPEPEPQPEPEILYGDANGDEVVNIRDAAFIGAMLAQGKDDQLPISADYNRDGKINIRDAAAIAIALASSNL